MPGVELYLSLGSNLGDRKENIINALRLVESKLGVPAKAVSSFYETEPWGFESDDMFLNAAAAYSLDLPEGYDAGQEGKRILAVCKEVESALGRTSDAEYDGSGRRIYKSRTIDVDILFLGYEAIDCEELTVPHKLMSQRAFVLVPLSEIISSDMREHFKVIFE